MVEGKGSEGKARYQKTEAVRQLEQLATADALRRYPAHTEATLARRVFRDDDANNLTRCITAYLKLKGAFVSRLNNGGIYDMRLQRYRPGTNRRGLPDIIATYQGKSLFIEVKHGRDRMSEHQEAIRAEHTQSGGLFYVARSFSEFKDWIDNI